LEESQNAVRKISFFFVAVVSVLLFLSFLSLYQAVETYRRTGSPDYLTVTMSVSAIALSSYMILQMRRKPVKLGFEPPKVYTTVECPNCQFKSTREFQEGDYVFKEVENCPKCSGKMFISFIYRIADEEKK